MIAAGLILLAIGAADLVREFLPAARRWIGLLVGAIVLIAVGALSDALVGALVALVVAAGWVWLAPVGGRARAGFGPVVLVAALCAGLVTWLPARADAGVIGAYWQFPTPVGTLSFDHFALVLGAVVFLLESANVVVRTALAQEHVAVAQVVADASPIEKAETEAKAETQAKAETAETPDPERGAESPAASHAGHAHTDAATAAPATRAEAAASVLPGPALKGGRLIGPLERLLVFALTLAAMYPLLAAILAAKGIVRFPEISRDSAAGNRAEYFLIGSLVSWVLALAAALLVWWAFATP